MAQKYDKTKKSLFLQSFKRIDRDFLYIVIFDILFYLLLILVVLSASNIVISVLNELKDVVPFLSTLQAHLPDLANIPYLEQELDTVLSSLKLMAIKLISVVLIALAIIYISSTYFKGLVWSRTLKIRFDWLFYRKFLLLRLAWYAIWAVLFSLILFFIKREVIAVYLIIFGLLFFYFTIIMLCLFRKESKIFSIIKQAFILGIKKFYVLIIPYFLNCAVLALITLIFLPFFSISNIVLVVYPIVTIIFLAWSRIYISTIIKKIEKESFIL